MLEHKHKVILSLNLKKLANCVNDLKMILILQNEVLLLQSCQFHLHDNARAGPHAGKFISPAQSIAQAQHMFCMLIVRVKRSFILLLSFF